ncbi:hypothetical protein LNTAR_14997 [Lentisphaera araneosa HTCC2155]|uniref:Uncharacterized protein n=1 Tax=Lentisphaera araneosa HTCC2155 TaxID=313628 RepID=A6DHQ1_9BACT|nr:hypothetical protein [Lentisphaera araneosa]EDM29134.1 hypothetical protein LNTAR_14997 [Lentisphaera araneosa HTCC2155]
MDKLLTVYTEKVFELSSRIFAAKNLYKDINCKDPGGREYVTKSVPIDLSDKYICAEDSIPYNFALARELVGKPEALQAQLISLLKYLPEVLKGEDPLNYQRGMDDRSIDFLRTNIKIVNEVLYDVEIKADFYPQPHALISLIFSIVKDVAKLQESSITALAEHLKVDSKTLTKNEDYLYMAPMLCGGPWADIAQRKCEGACFPISLEQMCYSSAIG